MAGQFLEIFWLLRHVFWGVNHFQPYQNDLQRPSGLKPIRILAVHISILIIVYFLSARNLLEKVPTPEASSLEGLVQGCCATFGHSQDHNFCWRRCWSRWWRRCWSRSQPQRSSGSRLSYFLRDLGVTLSISSLLTAPPPWPWASGTWNPWNWRIHPPRPHRFWHWRLHGSLWRRALPVRAGPTGPIRCIRGIRGTPAPLGSLPAIGAVPAVPAVPAMSSPAAPHIILPNERGELRLPQ